MDGVIVLQVLIILCILGGIYYLLRFYRASMLEKRLASFAIISNKNKELSLFDKIYNICWIVIRKIGVFLKKSQVLYKYGEKYNKFIIFEEREDKEGIDYIAIKFLLSFLVIILSTITLLFHTIHISFMFFITLFVVSFLLPDIYLSIIFMKKRKRIEEDLLKAIIIMNSAFQSGRNIMQAIEVVRDELEGPIQDEFKKIYLDITYGLSLDIVFGRFYERVQLEDAKYITTSLTLLNKTGGDIVKVFAMIEQSIFDRKNLKNELNSFTASSQFVFKLLIGLPIVFILLIYIINPEYFNPMFTTPLGIIISILIVLLYTLYILVIRKVLRVEI